MRSLWRLLCAFSISFGLMACDGIDDPFVDDDDDDDDVDELIVTTSVVDNWWTWSLFAMTDPLNGPSISSGVTSLTAGDEPPADAESAAQIVADSVDRYFTPAGCASVEREGSALTYRLSDCSGPLLPARIDGTLEASFAMDGDAIDFEVASRELEVNGAPSEFAVNGSYTASEDTRIVQYSAKPTLATFGATFSASFDGTVTWTAGSNCIMSDGSGRLANDGRSWDVTLAGFARCADACPSAGVVTLSDGAGTMTLTFDGGEQATFRQSSGETESIALDCERAATTAE